MNTVAGYAMSSWERGYGDFEMKPDLDTLRPIPWHPGTVLLMADLAWADGKDVVASPRQILRRQLARLEERGLVANAGTELEFMVFRDTYEEAWHKGYRDLEPANLYNNDYSMLGGARVEPLLRRIRNEMAAAGMTVENSKGECNLGQHEINFHYGDALGGGRRPRDLQERRQGDRGAGGLRDHLHGEVRRARGQLVPHPLLAREREGRQRVRRGPADVRALRRGPAGRDARADALLRARTSTRTSASPRARSRPPPSPGATTTARARCASSATARACGSRTGCRARTSTRTLRSRG